MDQGYKVPTLMLNRLTLKWSDQNKDISCNTAQYQYGQYLQSWIFF